MGHDHSKTNLMIRNPEVTAMARSNILWARYCAVCLGGSGHSCSFPDQKKLRLKPMLFGMPSSRAMNGGLLNLQSGIEETFLLESDDTKLKLLATLVKKYSKGERRAHMAQPSKAKRRGLLQATNRSAHLSGIRGFRLFRAWHSDLGSFRALLNFRALCSRLSDGALMATLPSGSNLT